jgi:hypothetical protein
VLLKSSLKLIIHHNDIAVFVDCGLLRLILVVGAIEGQFVELGSELFVRLFKVVNFRFRLGDGLEQ